MPPPSPWAWGLGHWWQEGFCLPGPHLGTEQSLEPLSTGPTGTHAHVVLCPQPSLSANTEALRNLQSPGRQGKQFWGPRL